MKHSLFDRSLLPPARCEFLLLSDTHYMLDVGDRPLEFESRRQQSRRAGVAFALAAALEPDFAVHLGDLVQEYPDTPDFATALDQALEQLRASSLPVRHVAGNHDVGDKPDTTMPTHPVDARALDLYHSRFGPSWYSFDRDDLHFVVINSQIMNTGLIQEDEQQSWLEEDLSNHAGRRLFLFLHMPPFLWHPDEPHLGHYDNLGEPARTWLLDQVRRHRVEMLFAGHVHFPFYDQVAGTRQVILPSTSFTRPGFGHLFTSAPPPEQGRDDAPKLGFYLCRVLDDRVDLHLIRTSDATELDSTTRLLTPTPAAFPNAPLGITLLHPLAPSTEIPLAWPSTIRQPVRNDYPFLSLLELGATGVRVPWTDFEQPLQLRRLSMLRAEGLQIQAFGPAPDELDLHHLLDAHPACADAWELQLPGSPWPTNHHLEQFRDCGRRTPLALSTIIPGERVSGKQHPRTRIGYRPDELPELDRRLGEAATSVDAVLCRLDGDDGPWETARDLSAATSLSHIGRIDWLLTLPGEDDRRNGLLAAEALFAVTLTPGARLYLDPLIDLDRTMDVRHGLLDTLCNPRPIFHALRCLNPLLREFQNTHLAPAEREIDQLRILQLASAAVSISLLLPEDPLALPEELFTPGIHLYRLHRGTVEQPESPHQLHIDGPSLLIDRR